MSKLTQLLTPKRRLYSVSPSQVSAYRQCPRLWFWASILNDRSPPMRANVLGDAVHKAMEHYVQTGEILPTVTLPAPYLANNPDGTVATETFQTLEFVQAAMDHIPPHALDDHWKQFRPEAGCGVMVEQLGEMGTYEGGPSWVQYIDLVVAQPGDVGEIIDYKTRSSFRYNKTPEELLHDVQLMSNLRWLFLSSDYKSGRIKHLNLLTRGKVKCVPTFVDVTREQVELEWQRTLATVREMVEWAAIASEAEKLPPNTESCDMYGGCRKRGPCGFDKPVTLRRFDPMSAAGGSDLLKSLLATAAPGTAAVLPSPQFVAAQVAPVALSPGLLSTLGLAPTGPQATPPAPPVPTPVVGLVVPAQGTAPAPPPVVTSLSALLKPKEEAQPLPTVVVSLPSEAPAPAPSEAAQAAAVAAGYPVDFKPTGGIVPPDASPRTSTPEQVDAGNKEAPAEGDEVEEAQTPAQLAAGEKPKRKRRTKAEMEAARAGATTQALVPIAVALHVDGAAVAAVVNSVPEVTAATLGLPSPAEQATKLSDLIGQGTAATSVPAGAVLASLLPPTDAAPPPVDPAVTQARHRVMTPDPQFACAVKYVFIDCLPGKGWPAEDAPVDAREFWEQIRNQASAAANVADYRFVKYESKAYLSASVRVSLRGLPHSVYVDSSVPDIQELLTAVVPYAQLVVHGR